jgi:hypothetical protein
LVPSAEEATHPQPTFGAVVWVQVKPESAEAKTAPSSHALAAATSLVPSADEATHDQALFGAVV